jgi:hypothetical protein
VLRSDERQKTIYTLKDLDKVKPSPVVSEMDSLLDDLRSEVSHGKVLIIVGAGGSVASTRNAPVASWTGLLEHGVIRCVEVAQVPDNDWADRTLAQIRSGDVLDMVAAAENISRRLRQSHKGAYSKWLRDTVGSLEVADPSLIEALAALDLPIATTNYDGLITDVTKLAPVTWKDRAKAERWLRGEPGVLHLHGHWESPESVVLGISSYDDVLGDEHTQALLRSCLLSRTLLFVGYGAGLADPNFEALLEWSRRVLTESEYYHFRLAREDQVEHLQQFHPPSERIRVLS